MLCGRLCGGRLFYYLESVRHPDKRRPPSYSISSQNSDDWEESRVRRRGIRCGGKHVQHAEKLSEGRNSEQFFLHPATARDLRGRFRLDVSHSYAPELGAPDVGSRLPKKSWPPIFERSSPASMTGEFDGAVNEVVGLPTA